MFEQGGPSEMVHAVDLSSSLNEEGLIPDILWDEEFTKKLFGDLNHDILRPPGDSKIIILSDSDEDQEEVCQENTTDTEIVATSAIVNPASTAPTDTDDAPTGVKMIIVMIAPR
jgi:hypothetical protein